MTNLIVNGSLKRESSQNLDEWISIKFAQVTWCVFKKELRAVHFFSRTVRLCCWLYSHWLAAKRPCRLLGMTDCYAMGCCCPVLPPENGIRRVTKFYSLPTASEMSLVTTELSKAFPYILEMLCFWLLQNIKYTTVWDHSWTCLWCE